MKPRFWKGQKVIVEGGDQQMIVHNFAYDEINDPSIPAAFRFAQKPIGSRYNGYVWCTWVDKENRPQTEKFYEDDLVLA